MIKKNIYVAMFLCAILFVNSLYAMYNSNGKREFFEEQHQENKKRTKYENVDQPNLNAPIIEQGNDIFVFDKDATQSLQVNTFAKSLIFKVYPSEDLLTKIGFKFPNVQKIDISGILRDVSSDRKKKFLREFLNFQTLKELICNNNMLTDIELSILPTFTHSSNNDNWLQSIHLNQNLITDTGAKDIAFRGRKLTELSITHNQIEESGALSIVKMPQLKKLSLNKNLISNEIWHNIQKIATEKSLIFIESKEDFFKQTFTDNLALNNEPKLPQTLIKNFTPVLPLSMQNKPYSVPSENSYYVNNNNSNIGQNIPQRQLQNVQKNVYIFDLEAKRKIKFENSFQEEYIDTIIFKLAPSKKEIEFFRDKFQFLKKIDASPLFGKIYSNIVPDPNIKVNLIYQFKYFVNQDKRTAFGLFVKAAKKREPIISFNIKKSRLYMERELFKKNNNPNVFINALFSKSENSNVQIVTSQKQNNYAPQINSERNNNSNIKQIKAQQQNTKNNVYIFDLEAKRKIKFEDQFQEDYIDTIIFKLVPSEKEIEFFRDKFQFLKKIDASPLFGKIYSNIVPDPNIRVNLIYQFKYFVNQDKRTAFGIFAEEAKKSEPKIAFDIKKSRLYMEGELFKKNNNPNVFINALFSKSENSNNQIVTSQKQNNYAPQVNAQHYNSNIVQQRQPQNMMPNPQMSIQNNYAPQVNAQHYNSNIVQQRQPQNMMPNPQMSIQNNHAPQVNAQHYNSNNVQQRQPQNMMFNQQMPIQNNHAPQVNAQHYNSNNVQQRQPQNMMPNPQMSIQNNYAPQVNAQHYNSNIVQQRQPQNMIPNPQMSIQNNYTPQVNAQHYNSNNVQQRQSQNMMPNPQMSIQNNYAPQVNVQQYNSNNVQQRQPQNMMPNPQMSIQNNYAPQVNAQYYNSNNVQQRQPQNMMFNQQMPIQNVAPNTLNVPEEKNRNDSDYKELLDLFYTENIEKNVLTPLEDAIFSFGNNERMLLQQGNPILLEHKINFLHFEICPTENEIFQLFQNFNYIEKINISFVLPKDKIERIKILTALKIFQHLKELITEGNELTDKDIVCIAQELPGLTSLNLDNNLIGDNGAGSVLQMQNLKKLSIKSNKIKDKGAREIAAMDNLEVFYYDNNEITPSGHRNIEQLRDDVLFMHSLSEQN